MKMWIQDGQFYGASEQSIEGRTIRECWKRAAQMLSVGEPRRIIAAESFEGGKPVGRAICASLYDGEDWMRGKNGQVVRFASECRRG